MLSNKSNRPVFMVAVLLLIFVIARLAVGEFNFSRFVVAGSDFCDNSFDESLHIVDGPGYDGQFFYRLAMDPLDHSTTSYGVTLDHPKYRAQRIGYPGAAWLFSLGGMPQLVPVALILLNVLAFLMLFLLFRRISIDFKAPDYFQYFPLLIAGLWMALARDLSEILAVLFFSAAVYYSIRRQFFMMAIATLLALLTRDTAVIALSMYSLLFTVYLVRSDGLNLKVISKGIVLFLPFSILILWKVLLKETMPQEPTGQINLLPFKGLIFGMGSNMNFGNVKEFAESMYWFMYFIWNVSLITLIISQIRFNKLLNFSYESNLALCYLLWLLIAVFLGPAIYVDDWGFVRIFSMFNTIAFLLIVIGNYKVTKVFVSFSVFVIALTFVRLIIRI